VPHQGVGLGGIETPLTCREECENLEGGRWRRRIHRQRIYWAWRSPRKVLTMAGEVIQANLNHARRAQDLLFQGMVEWGIALAVIAEPYSIPPQWLGDRDGSVALARGPDRGGPPLVLLERGSGFVAAR